MKRNPFYTLEKIADIPYLLPTGQMIADQTRALRLNDTGVYLWSLLEEERTFDELVSSCANYYELPQEDLPALEEDIRQFLNTLTVHGILFHSRPSASGNPVSGNLTSDKSTSGNPSYRKYVNIAGLTCRIAGPKEAISQCFDPFITAETDTVDQYIEIVSYAPYVKENGSLILRNEELMIIECAKKYILLFPAFKQVAEVHLRKDAARAIIYCLPPFTSELQENIFHVIRHVFLYLAQTNHIAAIHSSSILYRGKAWLFSAPSGTGKSTHANLWKSLLDTPVINGDLNLIAMSGTQPVVYGSPWCGTSGIYDINTYPLGGIILLKQASIDVVKHLSEDKKRLMIMQRFISPAWDKEMLHHNLQLANNIASQILICQLDCTPDKTALEAIRKEIDNYLQI